MRLGLGLAWGLTGKLGSGIDGGVSLTAPVLTWTSAETVDPPEFEIDLTNPQEGDEVRLYRDGVQVGSHTLTADELSSLTFDLGLTAWGNGTYAATAKHVRGATESAASNTETVTINAVEAETTALIARMTTAPDATRKGHINTLIKALKDGGLWTKLELFYVLAAHDAQAAQRNWVTDAYNLTPTNSPTFTTDRGYAGNGSNAYLGTGLNHSAATKALQESQFWALGNRTNVTEGSSQYALGTDAFGSTNRLGFTADMQVVIGVGGTAQTITGMAADPTGRYLATRNPGGSVLAYKNNVQIYSSTTLPSTANPANQITLLRTSTSYGSMEISYYALGSGITSGEAAAFDAAITAYLTAVGA